MNKRLSLVIFHYGAGQEPPRALDLGIHTFYLFRGLAGLFEDVDELSKTQLKELQRDVKEGARPQDEPWVLWALSLMCDHLLIEDHEWGTFGDGLRQLMEQLGPQARRELKVLYEKLVEIRPCNVVLSTAQRDDPEIFKYKLSKAKIQDYLELKPQQLDYLELVSRCRDLRQQAWVDFEDLKAQLPRIS